MISAFSIDDKKSNIARIISEHRSEYILGFQNNDIQQISKLSLKNQLYYIGDFIKYSVTNNSISNIELLPRKNVICKSSNTTKKSYNFSEYNQILATNVDQLFIFIPLDKNFSLSKIERYILVFSQQNVNVTIVLSKKDLFSNYKEYLSQVKQLYPKINICPISLYDELSIKKFKELLIPGKTGMFIGSSGAGKSSLLNHLQTNYKARVNNVRNDYKGKHTTTSSLIIFCPEIEYNIIDTPGFKSIDTTLDIDKKILFEEIEEYAKYCKFNDCLHLTEPKCAVKEAVNNNIIRPEILERYHYNIKKLELLSKRRTNWRL